MNSKFFEHAELINKAYNVSSDYSLDRQYDFMFIFDDDITTVLHSVQVYRLLKKQNPVMQLVMVGGEGLLATAFRVMRLSLKIKGIFKPKLKKYLSELRQETEAQRLKRVAVALGIPESDIRVLDSGHNTTENLRVMSRLADGKKSLVVSTQRLAMIFKASAEFQCNRYPKMFGMKLFKFDMMVIHQSVSETLQRYNFQIAGHGRVALHFFASLVRRFDIYDGKFLEKPFEPSPEVRKAAAELEKRFFIKQRLGGIKKLIAYCQYVPIIWDIFRNAEKYCSSERIIINIKARELLS